MGFTLRITNAPSGAAKWHADFAERSFDYDPMADSGWLVIDKIWDYPSDPRGVTTLRIWIVDAQNNLLFIATKQGPVNDGQDYEFNGSTRKLTVVTVVPPPVVHIAFIDAIFSFVWDIGDWFYGAYLETKSWWVVGPLFSGICWGIYRVVRSLLTPIAHFGEWADDVWKKVQQILTSEGILGLIKSWFPDLGAVIEWFIGRWNWLWQTVGQWWDTTKPIVLGWIDIATEGFNALRVLWDEFWKITWPKWLAKLEVLGGEVSDFFTHTLPNLLDYLKLENWWNGKLFAIDGLIGSKLVEWFPFYDDLVEIWNDVLEFFSDPLEFLLNRFFDWFLGPEE